MSRVFRNVVVIVFLGMTPAAAQLPPEIQADRYLLAARQAIERQDFTAAQTALDKMSSLETEKGLKLPEEFYFRSAQVAHQTHRPARAVRMVTRYLEIVGRDGKQYMAALELLNAAEAQTFNAAQTCQGKPKGSECWKELANQPGCHVWDHHLVPDQTVTWTAECAESLAQGRGTLKWVSDGGKKTTESSGRLESGKHHGRWRIRYWNGHVNEGPYEQGRRHGKWVIQWADDGGNLSGNQMEGPYVEGKIQGLWTVRWTDGSIEKRLYVDGKMHGQVAGRNVAGDTWEVSFVEGKKQGQSTQRTAEGKVSEGSYVEDRKHGAWTERAWTGIYVEGKKHGRWVRRNNDGQIVEQGSYVEGKKDGTWTINPGGGNERSVTYDRSNPYDRSKVDPIRPEMAVIPGGSFRMGCVSGQDCFDPEHPVHTVRVESFELSKYEVTFEEYDRFTAATGRNPAGDSGWGRGRRPVIDVSWEDAVAYVRWLSGQTGERYRLPSEAEWEYAARAGSVTAYSWGNEIGRNRANCGGCGSQWDNGQTAPVGSFGPNGWGLHDMHGNVWEWAQDCWNDSYRGAPSDGSAWESGECPRRVLRGGSWGSDPRILRSAYRFRFTATIRDRYGGFRVARTVTP